MKGLKDFQRDTVAYLLDRYFGADPTRRCRRWGSGVAYRLAPNRLARSDDRSQGAGDPPPRGESTAYRGRATQTRTRQLTS